jgi:hypothetical protein
MAHDHGQASRQAPGPGQPPHPSAGAGTMGMDCPMMGAGMGGRGMMGGGMMGGERGMMGMAMGAGAAGPSDPKAEARMLRLRGDLMKAMGDVLLKHADAIEREK